MNKLRNCLVILVVLLLSITTFSYATDITNDVQDEAAKEEQNYELISGVDDSNEEESEKVDDNGDKKFSEDNKIDNKLKQEDNQNTDKREDAKEIIKKYDDKSVFSSNLKTSNVESSNYTLEDGIYEIETGVNSSKVVEVINATVLSGGNVQIFTRNKSAMCQRVNVRSVGDGYYTITFAHSQKMLDVANGSDKEGTNVWQCNSNNSDAQKWFIKYDNDGYYNIISKCNKMYLTVEGGKNVNCANIVVSSAKNDISQKFRFNKIIPLSGTQTINDGIYQMATVLDTSKVVSVAGESNLSGGNVQLNSNEEIDSQKVSIKYIENGYYSIQFVHSGKYLDVANGYTADGTNVWQCNGNNSDAQKWLIQDAGDGYYHIISKCSESYLTVKNGLPYNSANIEINSFKNNNSQKFVLNKEVQITGTKSVEDGVYEIGVSSAIGKNIEVVDASKRTGANVQIFSDNDSMCQKLEIKYNGNGYYTLKFKHSGLFLDVANGNRANGTNVWQCTGNNSDAQLWIITKTDDGNYNIISKCSNKYLTVHNNEKNNGTNIEINAKDMISKSQVFTLDKIEEVTAQHTIEPGTYEIELGSNCAKAIEVVDARNDSGANVQTFLKNGAVCQQVIIESVDEKYYTLQFKHSKKYMYVENENTARGTNVCQYDKRNNDAQKWIIKDEGDGYYSIISKCSQHYLTVLNGNIITDKIYDDNSQKFKFNKVESDIVALQTIKDGLYEIETGVATSKVLDVWNGSRNLGANVQIYEKNNSDCQKVRVQYDGNGYYSLIFQHSGLYLDVVNANTAFGANVCQYSSNQSDAQKWIIQDAGDDYYYIISKCSETYLTVKNGASTNGTNIEINKYNDGKSQKFKFNEIRNSIGIDVSGHQGNIDWQKVKASGISFAILRCGYGQDMVEQDDVKFQRNMAECERLNIPYGVYIYSYALDEVSAESEARHVLRLVKGHNPKLGIWFDMEDADNYKKRNGMPSNDMLVRICVRFCNTIEANGYNAGIYASLSWLNNQLNDSRLDKYEKWVAQWNPICTYSKRFVMWQYTSQGTVNGIDGYVDMNKYYN